MTYALVRHELEHISDNVFCNSFSIQQKEFFDEKGFRIINLELEDNNSSFYILAGLASACLEELTRYP